MKYVKLIFLLSSLAIISGCSMHFTGQRYNQPAFGNMSYKPGSQGFTKTTGQLPSQISLRKYCPPVITQHSNTCFAIASAYAARTILYNKTIDFTPEPCLVDTNSFSDGFIVTVGTYATRKRVCRRGWDIASACMLMQSIGVPKVSAYGHGCPGQYITDALQQKAAAYKINANKLYDVCSDQATKVATVRNSLALGRPVVLAINAATRSFNNLSTDQWVPTEKERKKYRKKCGIAGHAVCVVGYDDNKNGGSFLIMNSWGPDWGNQGFCWIAYDDFAEFGMYAIEISNPKDDVPYYGYK